MGTKLDLFIFKESIKGQKDDFSCLQIFNEPEVTSVQMDLLF